MVLVPLGSSQTKIQVNGSTEYGPVEQGEDATYNLSISASTDYDTGGLYNFGKAQLQDGDFPIFFNPEGKYVDLEIETSNHGNEIDEAGYIELFSGSSLEDYSNSHGEKYIDYTTGPDTWNVSGTDKVWFFNGEHGEFSADISVRYEIRDIDASPSVDDVTKSNGI